MRGNENDAARQRLKRLLLGTPEKMRGVLTTQPLIHMTSSGLVRVENCRGILRYSAQQIVLDMGGSTLCIDGDALMMDVYQKTFIVLHGRIFAVRFAQKEAER